METSNTLGAGKSSNIFSRSSREYEDDEEALKWAALEKLPTYNRVRKGLIVSGNEGELKEIDVKRLQFDDRQELLDRLIKVTDEDNEKFLYKLKDRIERVGIEMPTIEVRFKDINVEAEVYVGDRGLPSNLNSLLNVFEAFANCLHILPSRKKPLSILHGISGIVRPGRMTLLLGPPGSGKTTLLLALAGKLTKDLKVSGNVTYNGHAMDEFVPQRTAAYVSQHDVHVGQMTVRETLSFSARCQGVGPRYDMLTELSRREKAANIKPDPDLDVFMKASSMPGNEASVITDYTLKILGLDICADTLVGDAMRRGISGGQKKRVTTGEILVGPAKALFMDEISTGLDSSTTYQIVNSFRQSVHILNGTALISLLQPAPETYDLFDDIILLSDGFIVYQGPREHVLEFFEHMGFKCPERKGVADFLQEVTSRKDQRQYWADRNSPYRFVPVSEFAEAFNSFHVGRRLNSELAVPYDKKRSHPAALTTTKYGASMKDLFKAAFDREMLLMKRDAFTHCFKIMQLAFVGIIAMTLFLRTHMHRDSVLSGRVYMGALYCAIIQFTFNGMNEIPMTILQLPIFYKQRDLLFYPAWAYALPPCILRIPITLIQTSLWVFMTYYVIGFDPNAERLFKQFLVLAALNQAVYGLFRCVSGLGRNMVIASTLGSAVMLLAMVLGGFIISRENIKPWWIWGYWISPLMYAQNAIAVNEFLGKSWSRILHGATEPLGVMVLKFNGLFSQAKWYWIGVSALVGHAVLFNFLYIICLTYLDPIGGSQTAMSEDSLEEKHANITGQMSNKIFNIDEIAVQKSSSTFDLIQKKKGMVLPFTPLSITFSDIRYSVNMPAEMKAQGVAEDKLELLKGISGSFRPGVLSALMGVSGAGKTTLMDVLAGRKTGGHIEGYITINGYPKKQETFARISGYCEQNDIHSPHVTIYESLVYSAWLRLPSDINSATRQMFVEEVMELVELTNLRNSLVGLPGVNGLSIEQRKRLTIAVELVANPSIIFMDEPTSGLDARAAAIVMRTVRNTVDTGRTVVCTIHQPSIDIFESFDELFLMKRGGEEIYVGPLGRHSCELIKYFEGIQGVSKIKDQYNPATWMLESTSLSQELILGVNFAQIYKDSELYRRNKALVEELSKPPPNSTDLYFPTKYSQSFKVQCIACLWKQNLSYWRDTEYNAIRILFTFLTSLFFGTVFWQLGGKIKKQADLMNAIGSMYAASTFIGCENALSVQPIVDTERTVFYREKAAGMYSALPYAFGQITVEVLYTLVQTIIYGPIVYGMMGLKWTAGKFFWYLFFLYFTLLYYTLYGMMAVGLTKNFGISSTVSTAFFGWWNLFTGFLIPRTRIPIWWRWFYWICPIAWTLYGMVSAQFGDVRENMETGETVAEFIESYFGYKYELLGASAAIVFAFALFFAFCYAIAIKFLNFQNR